MARIRYKSSAKRRGFKPQELSTVGIARMREESNRLIEGMRSRHQAEDQQRERERQALASDQAYQEQITKENNAIELKNLQIEAEREIGGINAKMQQADIDTKATMDILGSIASFSNTASKAVAQQQANKIKNLQAKPISIEDDLKAKRVEAQGAIALDAVNTEDQIKNNEDPRTAIRANVTNPGRLGPVERAQKDLNYRTQLPVFVDKLRSQQFTAANGKTFTGLDIDNDPQLVNDFYMNVRDQVVEASGLSAKDLPDTLELLEGMRMQKMQSALNESYKQDKALLVFQTETLFRSGNPDNIANGFSGGGPLGKATLLDMMDKAIADPNLSEKKREALLNFVLPIEGNTKPYRESHYEARVGPALAELRNNQTKLFNDELKARKAAANNWVLQSSDIVQTEIDNTRSPAELEEKEVELKEFWQDNFPGIEFPSTLTSRFSTAKKNNRVEIKSTIDNKYRNKELDLPFVNSIKDATLKKEATEKFMAQQVELYGEGYKPLMANIDSLAKSAADFSSTIPGDTNGTVEAIKAKMLQFVSGNHKFSLSNTGDANVTNKALKDYVDSAAIVDGSNGDPQNPFRYREGARGREYLEIGVPDPNLKQHLNWLRGKMATSQTLGDLIQNNPYLIPANKISEVSKAQATGQPIVFDDAVYYLSRHYKQKPTEIYNAIVKRVNEVSGSNIPSVTPNDFTELQDNSSPEWNKLLSSGNYDKINRARAQVVGQLPRRPSMGGGAMEPLQNLVLSGEGGFTSANRGYAGDTPGGIPGLDSMTVGDWKNLYKQGYNALGGPQFIESTFNGAVNRLKLPNDTVMSGDVQMELFNELILGGVKRPRLSAYLNGTSDNLQGALEDLSLEFASVANPYTGITSYPGVGNNAASISVNEASKVLQQLRNRLIN